MTLLRARGSLVAALSLSVAVALAGCAGAPAASVTSTVPSGAAAPAAKFPVEVGSCGFTMTVTQAPSRAVTMNQGATEVVLALGVQDRMAGTAFLDTSLPDKWLQAYKSIPVLSKEYPDKETLLAVNPDFIYGSYASAFEEKAAGTQEALKKSGVGTYLSPFACADKDKAESAEPSWEALWQEIHSIAAVFGVPERAEAIRSEQQATLENLKAQAVGAGKTIFWFDSGDKTPYAGAGHGGPQLVISAVGATNVFADVEGTWADVSWEQVVKADPDVIVLADASWSTAESKRKQLESDPVLSKLKAVKNGAIATVSFSESTPGVRLIDGASSLARQLAAWK